MKLIVGLGNPEAKYRKTFHNLGFLAAEDTAIKLGVKLNKKQCRAVLGVKSVKGDNVIVAEPQTYMNLSGESVRELIKKYKINTEDVLVIYDDYDLVKGEFRIRASGSAGTHNGMRNIVENLGSGEFPRIRIGIKDEDCKIPIIDYVLSEIRKEDYELFADVLNIVSDAAAEFACGEPVEKIMSKYNGKKSVR